MQPIPKPVPHMMPLSWAVSDWLLEGKVLLAAEKFQSADRGLIVGPAEHGIDCNTNAAAKSERVGGIPLCGRHGMDDIRFGTHEGDIHRIRGDANRGMGEARSRGRIKMMPGFPFPPKRKNYVGHKQIRQEDGARQVEQASPLSTPLHGFWPHALLQFVSLHCSGFLIPLRMIFLRELLSTNSRKGRPAFYEQAVVGKDLFSKEKRTKRR
jgi:hypothetical protein